jgi:hypothetical protein
MYSLLKIVKNVHEVLQCMLSIATARKQTRPVARRSLESPPPAVSRSLRRPLFAGLHRQLSAEAASNGHTRRSRCGRRGYDPSTPAGAYFDSVDVTSLPIFSKICVEIHAPVLLIFSIVVHAPSIYRTPGLFFPRSRRPLA